MTPETMIRSATALTPVPHVPEISLMTATERVGLWGLWEMTDRDPPPFWAFPWAGGQALARYVLDNPATVAGLHVLDAASGSGLVAIAAAKAGAAKVTAGDIDPNALAAVEANAAANGVAVDVRPFDFASVAGLATEGADVVLAADVFYQRELAAQALAYLSSAAESGAHVLVADPGRAFLPVKFLTRLARYAVPVLPVLEDAAVKRVAVYRLTARTSRAGHPPRPDPR